MFQHHFTTELNLHRSIETIEKTIKDSCNSLCLEVSGDAIRAKRVKLEVFEYLTAYTPKSVEVFASIKEAREIMNALGREYICATISCMDGALLARNYPNTYALNAADTRLAFELYQLKDPERLGEVSRVMMRQMY